MSPPNLETNTIDRMLAKGKAIICFLADGCMAHDHKFQWYGVIDHFDLQGQHSLVMMATVRILKRCDNPQDSRDTELGFETVPAVHISQLAGSAYIVFK
jgi:hypothetical protein